MSHEARERAIKNCIAVTKMIMDHKLAQPFNQPVDYVTLGIPQYPEIIKYPMDYGSIMTNLKQGVYTTMEDWTVDMQLVLTNAKIFNPTDHPVHQWASQLQALFDKKLAQLNARAEMAAFKTPPRVRRGPPMPDPDWAACRHVLRQVQQSPQAYPFLQAVDWKTLGIPDYPKIIKQPMDIGTIEKNLTSYLYSSLDEFASDMRLVFKNAKRYNLEGSDIHKMASDLEMQYEYHWKDMERSKGTKRAEPDSSSNQHTAPLNMQEPTSHLASHTSSVRDSGVSDDERRKLGNKINVLTGEQLGQLIDLVRDECPKSYEQFSEEECEIDIDALDRNNFDRLLTFVESC
jgi:bromodomain-containing factor 1